MGSETLPKLSCRIREAWRKSLVRSSPGRSAPDQQRSVQAARSTLHAAPAEAPQRQGAHGKIFLPVPIEPRCRRPLRNSSSSDEVARPGR